MYYDEINQADIIDLRDSSQKVEDYNRLIDREFNKAVAGTTRGFSKESKTVTLTQSRATTTGVLYITIPAGYKAIEGSSIFHNSTGSRVQYQSGQNVYISPAINCVINTDVIIAVEY